MRLQKSRSYLINDWLCNCRFEARRAPPSAMGFLDIFGASGLMWKCRACHGTQCLIHQLPPAQSRGSIPAPTPGPLPRGPGLGTTLPGLCSLGSSPKMLAFPPLCWALKGAASEARSEARQAAPVCSDPCWPPPAPEQPLHPHAFPGQGHTDPQLGPLLWLPVSQNPPHASGACCPSLERSMCPRAAFTCPRGWALSSHQYFPTPVHAFAPPPTRCLGGLCPLRDPGAQDATLWS